MKKKSLLIVLFLMTQMSLAVAPNDKVLSIEQSYISVRVIDVDALIYGVPDMPLRKMLNKPSVLEKNIISLLNFEIIYQYLNEHKLLQKEPFKSIKINSQFNQDRVARFTEQFGYSETEFKQHLEKIELRKKYYRALSDYFKQQISKENAEELAFEHYLINKNKYLQPERRELMLIQLDKENYSQQQANAILTSLKQDLSESFFEKTAAEKSNEVTAQSNHGRLGALTKQQLNLPFAEEIFLQPEPGLIDFLYQTDKSFFVARVINILPPSVRPFDEVKEAISTRVTENMAGQRFQNVINGESGKVIANPEAAKEIFNGRYDFLFKKTDTQAEKS